MPLTEWRTIPSLPFLEASDDGEIRRAPRLIAGSIKENGYAQITLWAGAAKGRRAKPYVHQLVCEAFHGPRPSPNHDAAHWDGNRLNNKPTNLRWATRKENEEDKIRHGTRLNAHHLRLRAMTHCLKGHEYTEENTRWYRGKRNCRKCARISQQARRLAEAFAEEDAP